MRTYVCSLCGGHLPLDAVVWRCPCGGLLDLSPPDPAAVVVDAGEWSLWRYRAVLPFAPGDGAWRRVSAGEGMTPLVAAPGRHPGLSLKLDFLMPTLSYKDRGAAVLVAKAAEIGVTHLIADSSGNAGVAIAAYAARCGIRAEVFVPAGTSTKKTGQLRAFGATVHEVPGTRTDAAAAAVAEVGRSGAFYASHVWNPLFTEGTKTFAYEVWEQSGGRRPAAVVVPAGNGTLLLGVAAGFAELAAAGLTTGVPRLVAVQAARCAPLAAAWDHRVGPGPWEPTVAEGIAIPAPPRLVQMLEVVRRSGGTVVTVDEVDILDARRHLAAAGLDVEPTAAAAWAACRVHPSTLDDGPVVVALSGAGLKSPA